MIKNQHIRRRPKLRNRNPKKHLSRSRACYQTQKTQVNRIEQLKEIIRAWGGNPEEALSKDALFRSYITETHDQTQNNQLSILAERISDRLHVRRLRNAPPQSLVPFGSYG